MYFIYFKKIIIMIITKNKNNIKKLNLILIIDVINNHYTIYNYNI